MAGYRFIRIKNEFWRREGVGLHILSENGYTTFVIEVPPDKIKIKEKEDKKLLELIDALETIMNEQGITDSDTRKEWTDKIIQAYLDQKPSLSILDPLIRGLVRSVRSLEVI